MDEFLNGVFEDCKPWQTSALGNNMNLLNNFKQNLNSYQKIIKKHQVKSKCQLPKIQLNRSKTTLAPAQTKPNKIPKFHKINLSTQLKHSKSEINKILIVKRQKTSLATYDQQNRAPLLSDRYKNKNDYPAKVFQVNFDQQNRYGRIKKRELHQIIFGSKNKPSKNSQLPHIL